MKIQQSPKVYRVMYWICWCLFFMRARLEVEGRDHIPTGAVILASNHVSKWDPVALGLALPTYQLRAMMKHELLDLPILGKLAVRTGGIPVRRGEADREALVQCKKALEHGAKLIVLPEGTRSRSGSLIEAKPGLVMLAQITNAPVVPIAIIGTNSMGMPFRRSTVTVRIGEPLMFDRSQRTPAQRHAALETLMYTIAAMLPPTMRGVYGQRTESIEQ